MRKNKSNKHVDETTVKPLSKEAQDFKQAIVSSNKLAIPIEHVFRTNKNCRHVKGTNKYYFDYPGEWRTISNQQLLIGIRATYLKIGINREFSFTLRYHDISGIREIIQWMTFNERFDITSKTLLQDICNSVNLWYSQYKSYRTFEFKCYGSILTIDSSVIGTVDYNLYWYEITDISDEWNKTLGINLRPIHLKQMMPSYLVKPNLIHNELDISASFVNQTEYQHLGYTGITFNPLKYYKVNSSDTEFYIELWSQDGLHPIEFVDNEKDSVIIEAVLTTAPFK